MDDRNLVRQRVRSALADERAAGSRDARQGREKARSSARRRRPDLIDAFKEACASLAVGVQTAPSDESVQGLILSILREEKVRTYVSWRSPVLDRFRIPECLDPEGFRDVLAPKGILESREAFKTAVASADVGITGADFGLADTGTLVLEAGPGRERCLSLLPPLHVAVLEAKNLLESTSDLLSGPLSSWKGSSPRPANITLITGSSKTADIEMELVHGVHGPGRLLVILRV